jgi:hypothetical protein
MPLVVVILLFFSFCVNFVTDSDVRLLCCPGFTFICISCAVRNTPSTEECTKQSTNLYIFHVLGFLFLCLFMSLHLKSYLVVFGVLDLSHPIMSDTRRFTNRPEDQAVQICSSATVGSWHVRVWWLVPIGLSRHLKILLSRWTENIYDLKGHDEPLSTF